MHNNKLTKKYFPVFPEESVQLTSLKRYKSQQLKCSLMKYYISATALKIQNTKFYEERCSFLGTDEHTYFYVTPLPTTKFGLLLRDSLTHPMLSTMLFSFDPKTSMSLVTRFDP